MSAGQIVSPDGPWGRYQARIGYYVSETIPKVLAAFDYQAPSDAAAGSIADRLANALCGTSSWGPYHEVTRLEG